MNIVEKTKYSENQEIAQAKTINENNIAIFPVYKPIRIGIDNIESKATDSPMQFFLNILNTKLIIKTNNKMGIQTTKNSTFLIWRNLNTKHIIVSNDSIE